MSEFKYLFSPLKIGSVVIPNRIHFAAHMTNFGEDQQISERHVYYYRERAKGGCGLITTEEMTVHPTDHAYEKLVDAFDSRVIPGYQRLTRAIHEYDTKIFAQLNHNGMQADGKISRLPVWGPSAGADPRPDRPGIQAAVPSGVSQFSSVIHISYLLPCPSGCGSRYGPPQAVWLPARPCPLQRAL